MAWWLNPHTESSLIIKAEKRCRKFLQSQTKVKNRQETGGATAAAIQLNHKMIGPFLLLELQTNLIGSRSVSLSLIVTLNLIRGVTEKQTEELQLRF